MPEPVSTNRGTSPLREQIMAQLLETGSATTHVSEILMPLATWRYLARATARQLERPIETTANEDRAWAVLRDWPSGPDEQAKHDAAIRAASDAVAVRQTLVSAIAAMETKREPNARQLLRLAKPRNE